MTEQPRFSGELSQIGLTADDIANRGLVAVGYGVNEIFPPYNGRLHRARAQKILGRVEKSNSPATFAYFDFIDADWETLFPETKVIEVVVGYTSLCVTLVVTDITNAGLFALVESGMTFEDRAYYPNFALSRRLKEGVLESPQMQHLRLRRGKHIFYKTGAERN